MRKDYDNIEFDDDEEFTPNIEIDVDELPDTYEIPIPIFKCMFSLTDKYEIEEDGFLSDKLEQLLNSVFESFGTEVVDFDYNYDDDTIYIESILWAD